MLRLPRALLCSLLCLQPPPHPDNLFPSTLLCTCAHRPRHPRTATPRFYRTSKPTFDRTGTILETLELEKLRRSCHLDELEVKTMLRSWKALEEKMPLIQNDVLELLSPGVMLMSTLPFCPSSPLPSSPIRSSCRPQLKAVPGAQVFGAQFGSRTRRTLKDRARE